ncbi:MAG: glyoxylate/hydroxypyruvate reductase A [Burkholderiaceae bacterium]|nr:glyoxylate/hydroxypyruvate reductase A [Burkholderiaceae bacterium]
MAVLLLTQPQPPEPVAAALRALDPALALATSLDGIDPATVDCLVAYRLPADLLPRLTGLRLLCAASSGVDKLLATPGLPHDLPVVRVVDALQSAQIAQYVLGQAIAHVRGFARYREQQARAHWQRHAPPAFGSSRASVLGLGQVGEPVARLLAAAGFAVTGWSRSPRRLDGLDGLNGLGSPDGLACCHGAEGLATALGQAEVVVCTLPLTPLTAGLLDAERLGLMAPGALLINVGRGELVDDAALWALLREGRLGGAVLDVHRQEPLPPQSPAWSVPGLTLTPHIASQPSAQAIAHSVVQSLHCLQAGLPLPHLVVRQRGY